MSPAPSSTRPAPDEAWWQSQLSRTAWQCAVEALRGRRGPGGAEAESLADQAQAAAKDAVKRLVELCGVQEQPTDYAAALGLRVVDVGSTGLQLPYFSMYDERQRVIEVNQTLIRRLERYLARVGHPELAPKDRLRQVAVAHEVYHDLAARLPRPPASLAQRWRQREETARQEAVDEAAAVWFSQAMLALSYSPSVYFAAAEQMGSEGLPQGGDIELPESIEVGGFGPFKWRRY